MTYFGIDRKRQILYSYVDGALDGNPLRRCSPGYAGKMLAFKLFYIHPETGELGIHIYISSQCSHYNRFFIK